MKKPEPGSIAEVYVKALEKQHKESREKEMLLAENRWLKTTALMSTKTALLSLEQTIEAEDQLLPYKKGQPKAQPKGADANKKKGEKTHNDSVKIATSYLEYHCRHKPNDDVDDDVFITYIQSKLPMYNGKPRDPKRIRKAIKEARKILKTPR